ncbi:MAG: hypothetical protein HYV19_04260 [Gemmatimonadetes bacterium]|nr:hypothetical protein [Gemmatimonadota bacterium]
MQLEYRLRIRDASTSLNPEGTTDALTFTSIAGGTNPYISEVPSGDGAEFNPLTGSVREGAYTVRVIDPITGTDGTGTIRLITNALEDAGYRQQLLSRRCYVEFRQNGGAWQTLTAGYLTSIRLVSALEYEFAIGDSRRIGLNRKIFTGGLPSGAGRGCLFGGPIINGFLNIEDRGGWTFRVVDVSSRQIACTFVSGYADSHAATTTKVKEAKRQPKDSHIAPMDAQALKYVADTTLPGMTSKRAYPGLRLKLSVNGVANAGAHVPVPAVRIIGGEQLVSDVPRIPDHALVFQWDTTAGGAAPAVGDILRVHCFVDAVSEDSPVYVDAHPVDILTALWDDSDPAVQYPSPIPYDAVSAAAVKARIGADVRLALRITEPQTLDDFIQRAIFAPFGVSARWNASGQLELFHTRLKDAGTPALTINTADLRSADPVIFDVSEASVVTGLTIGQEVYKPAPEGATDAALPSDGILVARQRVVSQQADATAFGTKEVTIEIPGMVHLVDSTESDMSALVAATALEMFDRFGRGAPSAEVDLLATAAAAAAKIGDELYLQAPHYPNRNYRVGESSVGARIMQLVQRTEAPEGPRFKLVDAGLAQQPVVPAAVITVAASGSDPRTVAEFTITNAAAINATAVLIVAVEWATGALSPAGNGQDFARYAAASCPTAAVPLPPVTPGSKVWVRARTEQAGRRPSAWTAWSSVTLTAMTAPSALAVSSIKKTAATLTWTNGSATDDVEVFVYEGAAPPADWRLYRVARLAAGSTRTVVRSLAGPGITYQVAVCHVTASGQRSTFATASVTTNSTLDGCPRPAGMFVMANRESAAGVTGIALALWAADTTLDIAIERAPDSGGSPGAFVEIARVPGTTSVFVDELPSDGAIYWYQIRHSAGGLGDSSYTAAQSGTPGGIPAGLVRPPAVDPIIEVSDTQTGTTGTTTLTVTDPQGRVTLVEFRTQTDPAAWSAWTPDASVPYSTTVTIPTGSGQWARIGYRVTGYDGLGTERVVAAGTELFDLNTSSDITVIDISFTHDGAAIVKVTGDSDTASIRVAVSTSAYPAAATVRAATAQNTRQYEATFPGPYNIGTRLYVSAFGYTAAGGGGTESDKMDFSAVREGQDVRVQEKLSESGTTGTVQLITTDPNGRISAWEYRTQTGRGAWSAWAAMTNTSPNNYEASVTIGEKVPSKIGWRIIGTSLTGQIGVGLFENVVTFAMGPVPMEPVIEATVREDGKVDVAVIGDSDTASLQVGFSTVSQAAADAALGSTVNARQTVFSYVGTLTLGQQGYVSVKAFSGTGASGSGSIVAQAQVYGYNGAKNAKLMNLSAGHARGYEDSNVVQSSGYCYASRLASETFSMAVLDFELPEGCTITAVETNLYDDGSMGTRAKTILWRLDSAGAYTDLTPSPLTAGTSGWQQIGVSGLSESTTGNRYMLITYFYPATSGTQDSQRMAGGKITYNSPNTGRTL